MREPPPCSCRIEDPEGTGADVDNDRRLISDVRERGWSVCVVADAPDQPAWAYSVGLWHTFRVPDLAMFGLLPLDMGKWINLVGELIRTGAKFRLDEPVHGILSGFPMLWRLAEESWYPQLFGYGTWFYQGWFPVAQMIWPDRQGKFPWEDGCGERCRTMQPMIWAPRP